MWVASIQAGTTDTQVLHGSRRHWPERPRIICEACTHRGPQDTVWPTLCWHCGHKLRSIDRMAASPQGIRIDMIGTGIPVQLGRKRGEMVQ